MMPNAVLAVRPLGRPWETSDPFLFCMYHKDAYPAGNDQLGPKASLAGRAIGQDFEGKDGWSMYHGNVVPGFPQHPHRGFETVTIMRDGYVDHSDSLGATARFGPGDVQWLTAGRGIVHSEMFPLLQADKPNPLELFQIWLNLPSADKMVDPHFSMLWDQDVPTKVVEDSNGRRSEIVVVAGNYNSVNAPAPPPKSWAAHADTDVAIWTIKIAAQGQLTLPAAKPDSSRSLYFFRGGKLRMDGEPIPVGARAVVRPDAELLLENGDGESELLLLQGRPIGEPVVQYGPFVMNSRSEIQKAFEDYQRTGFGGWPWSADDPVLPRTEGRFARHADGRIERVA